MEAVEVETILAFPEPSHPATRACVLNAIALRKTTLKKETTHQNRLLFQYGLQASNLPAKELIDHPFDTS